jgi:hypothetical protein
VWVLELELVWVLELELVWVLELELVWVLGQVQELLHHLHHHKQRLTPTLKSL